MSKLLAAATTITATAKSAVPAWPVDPESHSGVPLRK